MKLKNNLEKLWNLSIIEENDGSELKGHRFSIKQEDAEMAFSILFLATVIKQLYCFWQYRIFKKYRIAEDI